MVLHVDSNKVCFAMVVGKCLDYDDYCDGRRYCSGNMISALYKDNLPIKVMLPRLITIISEL